MESSIEMAKIDSKIICTPGQCRQAMTAAGVLIHRTKKVGMLAVEKDDYIQYVDVTRPVALT